jgi:uncharacterized membrane protein
MLAFPRFRLQLEAMEQPLKPITDLEESLAREAIELRSRAQSVPDGAARDDLLRRARQCETAARASAWANSPELQPPS